MKNPSPLRSDTPAPLTSPLVRFLFFLPPIRRYVFEAHMQSLPDFSSGNPEALFSISTRIGESKNSSRRSENLRQPRRLNFARDRFAADRMDASRRLLSSANSVEKFLSIPREMSEKNGKMAGNVWEKTARVSN